METSSSDFLLRSFSSPHLGSSPLLAPVPLTNVSYYVGLYEFAQGSSPRVVWDNDSKLLQNKDLFLLYIVNTPTEFPAETYTPKPTIIKSQYNEIFYLAIFIQINDVEARGFTRPVVLVIAHPIKKLITHLYKKSLNNLEKYALKLQKAAAETFPLDILKYTASIKLTIKKHPESKDLLQTKVNELENMMKIMKIEQQTNIEPYEADPEYFLHIKNDLRPIKKLTHFNDIKPDLIKFISKLPNDIIQSRFKLSTNSETYNMIESTFFKEYPKLSIIFKNKTIIDCLYTLYCGHNLYILANDTDEAHSIAARISVLTPFDTPIPIVSPHEVKPKQAQIICCMTFEPDLNSSVSLLDLDNNCEYSGIRCPPESILNRELPKGEHSATSLESLYSIELRRIGMRFLCKMIELSRRASQTEERIAQQMRSIGFAATDEQLVRNWTEMANKIISQMQ